MRGKYDHLFGPYGPNFRGTRQKFNQRCIEKEYELNRELTRDEVIALTQIPQGGKQAMSDLNFNADLHGHPKFYQILKEMAELHSRKNHDYAGDDPLSNLKASEEIGIPAWKSILVRLMDKWGRLKTFANTGNFEVKDESVRDTLMDNAVYSILCIIVLEEEKENKI